VITGDQDRPKETAEETLEETQEMVDHLLQEMMIMKGNCFLEI